MTNVQSRPADPVIIGQAPDHSEIRSITIRGGALVATFMSWGASLQELRHERLTHSLLLGSPDPAAWRDSLRYYGSVVGPVANRIAEGRFTLDGRTYETERNERAVTTLHGGYSGFAERNWQLDAYDSSSCEFTLRHSEGTGGFPGNLAVRVIYSLDDNDTLTVCIRGQSDAVTYFNPAFHGYWNLDGRPDVADHTLQILADHYLPVDARLIPLGAPVAVDGTICDYREPHVPHVDLDHNFCLADRRLPCRHVARLNADGVVLNIETTEPGLQVYSGGYIDTRPWKGHEGEPYGANAGLAIEPQAWPDTPNQQGYPNALLRAGERYEQVSRFRLRVD